MKNMTSIPRTFWQESQTSWPEGELLCEGRRPREGWAPWESPLGERGALSVMRGVEVNEAERREQQRRRDGKPSQCRAGENTAVTATAILNQLESDKSERERGQTERERRPE